MKTITLYHIQSGAVRGQVQVLDEFQHPARVAETIGAYAGNVPGDTHYLAGSPVAPAPRTDAAGVVFDPFVTAGSAITVSNLPAPCWALVDGKPLELANSTLNLGVATRGTRTVELMGAWRGTYTVTVEDEVDRGLRQDPRWQTLQNATPQQIEAWLAANVTSLASARQVFKVLLLAMRKLRA